LIGLGCVEWHTGRIIDKRSKKSLTIKRMCDKFNIKTTTLEEIMRELKASKIVCYDRSRKAYFVNRELFKKGGGLDEN
jgi:transcription initiation factor IIE alpha subunit